MNISQVWKAIWGLAVQKFHCPSYGHAQDQKRSGATYWKTLLNMSVLIQVSPNPL